MGLNDRVADLFQRGLADNSDHSIPLPVQNLAREIFIRPATHEGTGYLHSHPNGTLAFAGLPANVTKLSHYECTVIGKLRGEAANPIFCIEGEMGSGKTTTLRYLVKNVLSRMNCPDCPVYPKVINMCPGLIAYIDLRAERAAESDNVEYLIESLCEELHSRARAIIDDKGEYLKFLRHLFAAYRNREDGTGDIVARALIDDDPNLEGQVASDSEEFVTVVKDVVRRHAKQPEWNLLYQLLLWRYLVKTRFSGKRGCAFVILDNLDSVEPAIQRELLNKITQIVRSDQPEPPTFVFPMRPETRERSSKGSETIDVVHHEGPLPRDLVLERLSCFKNDPDKYLCGDAAIPVDLHEVVNQHLSRVCGLLETTDNAYFSFLKHAAGRSIRLGLILSQGIFTNRLSEMRNEELSAHFLVRSALTQGNPYLIGGAPACVCSLFDCQDSEECCPLLKPRILAFVEQRSEGADVTAVRSAMKSLGHCDHEIQSAINDLMQARCQLVRSNGSDQYHDDHWGGEGERLLLTAIGEGYINHLLFEVDFVQVMMLDYRCARSKGQRWPVYFENDGVINRLDALRLFLLDLLEYDKEQMRTLILEKRDIFGPAKLFGRHLLSSRIITRLYPGICRILIAAGRSAKVHGRNMETDPSKLLFDKIEQLVTTAEAESRNIMEVRMPETQRLVWPAEQSIR